MEEKIIGIMGGMGSETTVDLFRKIVAATPAKTDQEHLHIILDCNPKIPSRPAALLEGGRDPAPLLRSTARNLERAGADFLVVACDTAHLFYDRIVEAVRIPVLHIVEEAVSEAQRRYPGLQAAGVLAGAMASIGLRSFGRIGVKVLFFYTFTTVIASVVGVVMAIIMKPGIGLDPTVLSKLTAPKPAKAPALAQIFLNMVPTNIVDVAAKGEMIQMVVFAIFVLLIARVNPWQFYKRSLDYMMVAFTTRSSAASLPVALQVAKQKLDIHPPGDDPERHGLAGGRHRPDHRG